MKPIPLLAPFAWLYGGGVVLRNLAYDRKFFGIERVGVPVISVGNLTTGGTGKTPVVQLVAEMVTRRNVRVAVVSRGYKRTTTGMVEVSDGVTVKATAAEAGDEPFFLTLRLPQVSIVVDERRFRGARYAVEKLGAQAIVLDDGFQHRSLHRDLDIVLIDAAHSPFETGMLPAGYRREPLRSLRRAGVVLLTKTTPLTDVATLTGQIRKYSGARVFTSSFAVSSFRRAKTKFSVDLHSVRGKKAVAFCGIARPESFRKTLEEIGINVVAFLEFGDHHPYSADDLKKVASVFEKQAAEYIVTTEKDVSRLTATPADGFLERFPLYSIEMKTEIHERNDFEEMIASIAGEKKAQ